MSDAAEGAEKAPAAPVAPAPKAEVDMDAVNKVAESKAAEIADKKLKAAFKAMAGEEEKKSAHPVLQAFVEDPVGVLKALQDATLQKSREDSAKEKSFNDELQRSAAPIIEKYPDLQQHSDYVEAKIRSHLQAGLSVKEATTRGLEEVAKKLGLQSVDEIAEDRRLRGAGIPSVGAHSSGSGKDSARVDPAKSTADYLKGYKEKMKSFKVRKT